MYRFHADFLSVNPLAKYAQTQKFSNLSQITYICSSLHQDTCTKLLQIKTISVGLAPFKIQSVVPHVTPPGGHVKNSMLCGKVLILPKLRLNETTFYE